MRWGHLPTGSWNKQPLPSAVEVNVMIPIWPMDQPIGNAASCTTCCPWSTGAGLAISNPWIRGHVDSQVGQVRGELLAVRGFRQLLELFEACVRGWGLCDHCQNHQQVEGASPVLPASKQWRERRQGCLNVARQHTGQNRRAHQTNWSL